MTSKIEQVYINLINGKEIMKRENVTIYTLIYIYFIAYPDLFVLQNKDADYQFFNKKDMLLFT